MKKALRNPGIQAFVASIICILLGLLIGYVVLLFINPEGAAESILNVIKNFFTWSKPKTQLKQFGNTLAKTMPLLMCSLSILFAYKVGLFNIGAAGQYVAGSCACLYAYSRLLGPACSVGCRSSGLCPRCRALTALVHWNLDPRPGFGSLLSQGEPPSLKNCKSCCC